MSNINLRLYGDQLYPNISKYLEKYVSPQISKEEFISSYKSGKLILKSLLLKEKILIHPQILIEEASVEEININIPDEKENFEIHLNKIKCSISVKELNEEEIEKIIINDRTKIIEEFIKYAISKIEKSDGPSFLDNIIKSVVEKILNGILIDINNLELKLSIKNNNKNNFVFKIENTNFSIDKGIKIKNMNLIYQENLNVKNVIEKFNFNMDIIYENEEKNQKNKINISANEFKLQINKNIYHEFLYLYNIFADVEYKKIYLYYKKLIQYYRPKNEQNAKKDYKLLWKYSINTIIKLVKYVQSNEENIFDLNYLTQIKIIKEYLENNKKDDNILLPDIKNILIATKETVEQKVLKNKKGNFFAKSFSFFFGQKEEDKKEELTEEEQQIVSEIFDSENINQYLAMDNLNLNNFSSIINKIKLFFSNFSTEINFERLELILQNPSKAQSLFIKRMKIDFNYFNKEFDFGFFINDIGYDKDKSLFQKNDIFCDDVITLKINKQNLINLNIGFNNIELDEELFIFLLTFGKSIKTKKRIKLFHEKKSEGFIEKYKTEKMVKTIQNFSLMNNFHISNIPSFSIKSKDNKIDFKISDYSINETSINFKLEIRDSYSTILKDFCFNPRRENNQFIFHLDSPIEINLLNESSRIFFLNYLKYKKEISDNNNDNFYCCKNNNELFGFNYKLLTNIDFGKFDVNNYILDIIIRKININILEEKENYQSNLVLEDFTLLYKNKNLDINLNKIVVSTNLMSSIFWYMIDFESPLLDGYKNVINLTVKDSKDILPISSENENKENKNEVFENNLQIQNQINYNKLIEDILNEFALNLNIFIFNYHSNDFVLSLYFNNIKVSKRKNEEKISLFSSIDNWYLSINSPKIKIENKKIIENNQKITIGFDFNDEILKGELKSVYINMTMEEIYEIWANTEYLLNQINWDIILCKMDFKVDDFIVNLDKFKYSISKILFINFKELTVKDNAFYFTLLEFVTTNEKGNQIIYEKEISIDYYFTSSTENDISIKFNNINIEISQNDITSFLSYINIPPKKKEEEKLVRKNTFVPNTSSILSKKNNNMDLKGTKIPDFSSSSSSTLIKKISVSDKSSQIKKKFSLSLIINSPRVNLSFCLNDNSKLIEIYMESSKIKIKNIFYENILEHLLFTEFSYSILLGKINVIFYRKDNAFNILSKIAIADDNNNIDKNYIKEENNNNDKSKINNMNQIEIIKNQNGYKININQNELNIKIDALIMIYYYFLLVIQKDIFEDNLELVDLNIKNQKNSFQIEINLNDSQIQLCTPYNEDEKLNLEVNKFTFIYGTAKNFPYGNYVVTLNKLLIKMNMNNNFREIFFTDNDFNDFLQLQINYSEELLSANVLMDKLVINISYRDLVSFYKTYLFNIKMIDNYFQKAEEFYKITKKAEQNINNNNENKMKKQKEINFLINRESKTPKSFNNNNLTFTGEFNFEKLDIILIDNSKDCYHPFMNIINNKIYLILNPDKSFEASCSVQLYSYNYIACVWENTIENTSIKFSNSYTKQNIDITNNLKMEVNNIIINLSDMAISFTLMSLNNWFERFTDERRRLEIQANTIQKESKEELEEISKYTNNQIINYTGVKFKIIHNGKMLDCPLYEPVKLEYFNEFNKFKNKLKHFKHITLIYDDKNQFEIPLEKIITLRHFIKNGPSFVSDNILSENRTISIMLYSTIIFKNKSIFPLQVTIENNNSKLERLDLEPNSITGIPINLINEKNDFNFLINPKKSQGETEISNDYSKNFNLGSILILNPDVEYKEYIKFKERQLVYKLDYNISNVRTIVINSEFSIVNCLPCNLTVHFSKKKAIIEKCSQYYINDNFNQKLFIALSIHTGDGEFKTEAIDVLSLGSNKTEDKFLKFINGNKNFKIPYDLKKNEEENNLIIYAEYILYNQTNIVLSVISKDKENSKLCYGIKKNISLMTSKFDYKEAYLQLVNEKYFSRTIKIATFIETSPYTELEIRNKYGDKLKFNIKKKFSKINILNNPNFRDNILTLVFTIFPSCIITNLLPEKRFFVCDYQFQKSHLIIQPYNKNNFYFFGHGENALLGISLLDMTSNKYTHLIKFKSKTGVYTLSTFEDTFNIEIRKNPSNGCLDVFIIPNDIENSQITVENLSGEEIKIYQKNFEKYMQIFNNEEIQTLKIFDYGAPEFTIETPNSVVEIVLNNMEDQEKQIKLNQKILLLIQANGLKMKLVFYNFNKFKLLKSFNIINSYEIRINTIMISLIGDNEFQDRYLKKYNRYELLLILLNEISMKITIESKISGALSKKCINSIINIINFQIHNQISEKGKFPCILKNSDCFLTIYSEIDYYEKLKIIQMKNSDIMFGKIELGIDPQFFIELIDFFANILYRMNISNFIVNEIFQKNEEIKNEQEKKHNLITEYKQSKILLNAKNFQIPKIIINFEITNIGIKELFKGRIGISDFYYWLAKGLIGREHTLILEQFKYPSNNGGVGYFFKDLFYHIKSKFENKLINIGLKGLIGQIKNIFSFDDSDLNNMKNNRYREKRPFYDKFKYFKEYDKQEAFFINIFLTKYKYLKDKYYPLRIIFGFKQFYLFTTISMLVIDYKNYIISRDLYYFCLKKIEVDKLKVKIEFNQTIDSEDRCIIECENENIATNISKSLNEEMINNKENINDI